MEKKNILDVNDLRAVVSFFFRNCLDHDSLTTQDNLYHLYGIPNFFF